MQATPVLSFSPSLNTYSSCRLTEIAARVVQEFRNESEINYDDDDLYSHDEESALERSFNVKSQEQPQIEEEEEENHCEDEGEDDDFEFSFMCREPEISPISADEIFFNGQIKPAFPLFNTDLLLSDKEVRSERVSKPRRLSLGKLMTEERDSPSCSSSEAEELEGLPQGTYCVWKPKKEEDEENSSGKCKKSNSTGSSKRWRFRDLLNRSNSDGKDTFVVLTPSLSLKTKKKNEEKVEKFPFAGIPKTKRVSSVAEIPEPSGHEAHYARNRSMNAGDKRRSFPPYRQDLVGFFANVNGLSRSLRPF